MSFYRWDSFFVCHGSLILINRCFFFSYLVWNTICPFLCLSGCRPYPFYAVDLHPCFLFQNHRIFTSSHSRVKQILCMSAICTDLFFSMHCMLNKTLLLLGRWHRGGDYITVGKIYLVMRFSMQLTWWAFAFGVAAGHVFASKFNAELKNDFLHFSMKLLLFLTVLIVITGFYYAHDINLLVNRLSDPDLDQCMKWTMLAFLPANLSYIYGALYQAIHLKSVLFSFIYLYCDCEPSL